MRMLFLPGSIKSPAARFRLWQFAQPLRDLGHEVEVRVIIPPREWGSTPSSSRLGTPVRRAAALMRFVSALWITRDIERYDIVWMNRDLVPEIRVPNLEGWLCKRNPRLIFDFDDAIHIGPREAKLRRMLPGFAGITPGNRYLESFACQLNPNVSIFPTVVNTDHYVPAPARALGPTRIGWSGSWSTLQYCLPLLESVITKLAVDEDFEFIVIADVPPGKRWRGVRQHFIKWTPSTEIQGIQNIDIGLMPLRDEPFERGKCGLKAILYMGIGIPALVSPVGVNREIVLHGETGFHCATDEEWVNYLKLLLHDEPLRKKMGEAARQRVEQFYSVRSMLPRMLEIFERVAGKRGSNVTSSSMARPR